MKEKARLLHSGATSVVLPFVLVTSCFAFWGFANDITNPLVHAFSKIFRMGVADGTLVQVAFYGGYFLMAFPAAMFIRKYSYKAGILIGLALYAAGTMLFIPAKEIGLFYPFLLAYLVLTCGLAFLETSANPYILSMGPEETATRRLNLAQSFNPMGSLLGMFIAKNFIQARMNPLSSEQRFALPVDEFEAVKTADLNILIQPYWIIGLVIIGLFIAIYLAPMPKNHDRNHELRLKATLKNLWHCVRYREGVVAQFFYIGAQIMCWTFIIQYGVRVFTAQGMAEKDAAQLAQAYNIAAMMIFCFSRFICTFLLKFFQPGKLLFALALTGGFLTLGVILIDGTGGMYCLVGVSACMSLMFPTIYGIALDGLGDDAKFGAAGLIMSILGGAILPYFQAEIIDIGGTIAGLPAVNMSFILPLVCFIVVGLYGFRSSRPVRV